MKQFPAIIINNQNELNVNHHQNKTNQNNNKNEDDNDNKSLINLRDVQHHQQRLRQNSTPNIRFITPKSSSSTQTTRKQSSILNDDTDNKRKSIRTNHSDNNLMDLIKMTDYRNHSKNTYLDSSSKSLGNIEFNNAAFSIGCDPSTTTETLHDHSDFECKNFKYSSDNHLTSNDDHKESIIDDDADDINVTVDDTGADADDDDDDYDDDDDVNYDEDDANDKDKDKDEIVEEQQTKCLTEQQSAINKKENILDEVIKKTEETNIKHSMINTLSTSTQHMMQQQQQSMIRKRRSNNFLSNIMMSVSSYRQKSLEFNRLFQKEIDKSELLIGDFYCALNAIQGRIYISKDHIAFHHNIMGMFAKSLIFNCSNIVTISKANAALVIPNAIQLIVKQQQQQVLSSCSIANNNDDMEKDIGKDIVDKDAPLAMTLSNNSNIVNNQQQPQQQQKYLFTSFTQRDKTFALMETVWQRSNQKRSLSNQEISDLVHRFYGDNLGFMNDNEEQEFFRQQQQQDQIIVNSSVNNNRNNNDDNNSIINENKNNDDRIMIFDNDQQQQRRKSIENDHSAKLNGESLTEQQQQQHQQKQMANESEKSIIDCDINIKSMIPSPIDSSTPIATGPKSVTISEINLSSENEERRKNSMIDLSEAKEAISMDQSIIHNDEQQQQNNQHPSSSSNEMKSLSRFFQAASLSMVEGSCRCTKHPGTMIAEKILPFPVDYLFELIFIDENFIRYLHKIRQTTGTKITKWMPFEEKNRPETPLPEGDYDIRQSEYRTMKYTVKLTGMPLVKSALIFESQYILQSDLNRAYCIFTQIKNQGVPYSDSFLVNVTWCLNSCLPPKNGGDQKMKTKSSSKNQQQQQLQLPTYTRLRVYQNIHYIKNSLSLSLMKSAIEKNAQQGFQEMFDDFIKLLQTNRFDYVTQSQLFNESIITTTPKKRNDKSIDHDDTCDDDDQDDDDEDPLSNANNENDDRSIEAFMKESFNVGDRTTNDEINKSSFLSINIIEMIITIIQYSVNYSIDTIDTLTDSNLLKIVFILLLIIILVNIIILKQFHDFDTRITQMIDIIEQSMHTTTE